MEVEKSVKEYTFSLADKGTIKIRGEIVKHLFTLQTMLDDNPSEMSSVAIPLDPMVTTPIMQWIVDAYTIEEARDEPVSDLDDLYRDVAYHNKLASLRYPAYVPLLTLFGPEGQAPTKENFETLFALTRALNWLDDQRLLYMVLEKIYRLINAMTSEEIKALVKKRKLPDTTPTLPLVPYYQREELIIEFLSQSLPYELLRANRSFEKYINPISGITEDHQLFLTRDGVREHWDESGEIDELVLTGVPLLVASGDHALCLTTTGLYGRGSNTSGQLGIDNRDSYYVPWAKLNVDGEVLLVGAGAAYTIILTTTGLYGTGANEYGQLGLGSGKEEVSHFTRINVEGDIRGFTCGPYSLFVLTTKGLYACGKNVARNLSIQTTDSFVTVLTPVIRLRGTVLSMDAGADHTMVLTTEGLFGSGSNDYGEMGDYTWNRTKRFTQISTPGTKVLSVHCGLHYTILKTEDGLYAAGDNSEGQLTLDTEGQKALLQHGIRPGQSEFTKMLGVEGDVYSVTCLDDAVIILTTTGVYQSGLSLFLPTSDPTMEELRNYYTFTKLEIEMGYFLPSLTIDEEEEGPRKKQPRLQCEYCHGTAQFFAHQHTDKLAVCSKYCLLKNRALF